MDIEKIFLETIEQLQQGSRPRHRFNKEQLDALAQHWRSCINSPKELPKVLCLVDHLYGDSPHWEELIIQSLKEIKDEELLVLILGISHRQIINRRVRMGERVPFEFIQCFESLLDHQSPEVLEWSLRTIEQMGSQSIMLKQKVLQRKPGIRRLFNQHLKYGHEIIEILEKRWNIPL